MQANSANSNKQTELLVLCLKARGLPTFQKFIDVLRETFHGWIADDILDSYIDVTDKPALERQSFRVKDLLNKADNAISSENERKPDPYKQTYRHEQQKQISQQPNPTHYYFKPGLFFPPQASFVYSSEGWSYGRRAHREYEHSRRGRESPISQVPESLRELQKTLDDETSTASRNLTILRKEEVTIKALLQQNMRQQQGIYTKQEALKEASMKIKEINDSASNIIKPKLESDMKQTRKRLSALKRVPWNV